MNMRNALLLVILASVAVSVQQYLLPEREFWDSMRPQFNNYLIFKYSFSHLVHGEDLYALHTGHHGDYFKYSPTFALAMAPFHYLPDWLGLTLWSLLNSLILLAGLALLPAIDEKKKFVLVLFILLELIGNLQNEQSNAMVTGFILLTFGFLERRKMWLAALFVALGFYLKIFGIVAGVLFIFYPGKKEFIFSFLIWMALLLALPLIVVPPGYLLDQYQGWGALLNSDLDTRYGFSIMGILDKWFGIAISRQLVMGAGIVLLGSVLLRVRCYGEFPFRLIFLSALLMWGILFNHTAEPSGYILAMTGIGIWFFGGRRTGLRTGLTIASFVLVSLVSTDLMPAGVRNDIIYPYYIRTLPVLVIWIIAMADMFRYRVATSSLE